VQSVRVLNTLQVTITMQRDCISGHKSHDTEKGFASKT